jgi:hypothetical protein
MSTISQFAGSGVKQIITGFVNQVPPTNASAGTGEDYFYYDITHGGTLNTSKCTITFDGANGYPGYATNYNSAGTALTSNTRIVTTRLTSSTNLRLAAQFDFFIGNTAIYYYFTGRFTIVEYF